MPDWRRRSNTVSNASPGRGTGCGAMSVFRDETDLTLNPDLWGMISGRLDRAATSCC